MFTAAEMQAQGWLGLDLPGVLSAFGTRHWIIAYPPQVAAALAEARKARAAPGPLADMPTIDRLAVVWEVTDEAPFQKILQRLVPLAQAEIALLAAPRPSPVAAALAEFITDRVVRRRGE